jgi:hypothetical protein
MANGSTTQVTGGMGGASAFGGNGSTGFPGATNAGGGGGGGFVTVSGSPGGGGGAGGYAEFILKNPSGSYALNIGLGGTFGSGTATVGRAGGDGQIIVEEYYY